MKDKIKISQLIYNGEETEDKIRKISVIRLRDNDNDNSNSDYSLRNDKCQRKHKIIENFN